MPDIHIHREHHLGFKEARKVAFSWAEKAEEKFDMECTYEEGEKEDLLTFTRTGVKGTLLVDTARRGGSTGLPRNTRCWPKRSALSTGR